MRRIKVDVIYLYNGQDQELSATMEVPQNFEETTNNIIWLTKKIERLFRLQNVSIQKITYLS